MTWKKTKWQRLSFFTGTGREEGREKEGEGGRRDIGEGRGEIE
jgi:hypothetical protein